MKGLGSNLGRVKVKLKATDSCGDLTRRSRRIWIAKSIGENRWFLICQILAILYADRNDWRNNNLLGWGAIMKNFEQNLYASFFVFWTAILAAKVSSNSQQASPTGIHSIRNRSYGAVFERTQYSGATRRMAFTQRWCKPDCYKVRILLGALMLLWGIICLVFPIRHLHNDNFFRGNGLCRGRNLDFCVCGKFSL